MGQQDPAGNTSVPERPHRAHALDNRGSIVVPQVHFMLHCLAERGGCRQHAIEAIP